ncbi:MAG: 3-oxoacyl-[acyl-carrier protein] reductase [Flavobacteriales bacterium]|jgi:3-oxoacyl-[acyl-carrier protein] reductase|tara:strand:+ start:25 stop:723 length:699 start_codon:yes stop_codon:yes gene_type:complete
MKKYAVITGASSGIGYELALQWANLGYHAICIARREDKLAELKKKSPERIHPLVFDLVNFNEYPSLFKEIESITPYIDVLINNAGILINKPFDEFSPDEFDRMVNINYKAPYFLLQGLLPYIENSTLKSIINIGSIGGVDNTDKFPGLSIYSSSKGAISTLTECLAKELSVKNISINCLALGAVRTEMLSKAFPGYIPNLTSEKMAKFIMNFILQNDHIINGKVLQVAGVEV